MTCASASACVPGWSCASLAGQANPVCQCTPSPETCDGKDNDCNGVVDDGPLPDSQCAMQHAGFACIAGQCSCAATCGGTCVDTSTDKMNCGGCGQVCSHVCTGGRCLVGLQSGTGPALAVGGSTVYWAHQGNGVSVYGSVESMPITGGAPSTVAAVPGGGNPESIAVDSSYVYFTAEISLTNSDGLYRVPLDGGTIVTLGSDGTGAGGALGLAIDSRNAYWFSNLDQAIHRVPLDGGTDVTLASAGVEGLATDGTNVYWAQPAQGTIMKVPVTGGTPTTLASGQGSPRAIAVDSAYVYWGSGGTSTGATPASIMKVAVGGGTPITLATNLVAHPPSIAVDATHVYWVSPGSAAAGQPPAAICKVPLGGGTPVTLYSENGTTFFSLAVDATSAYWIDSLGGVLYRITPK
jgi:hypothetical protein